ncbi:DNA binding protein [Deinococcus sp. PESE-13]
MNPTRYILTRSCIEEGSMRLLKFNEASFPESGPVQFVDDRGKEYLAVVDRTQMQVLGLGELYHDHNLGVNDVLTVTPTEPGRYEVETVVKPYSTPRARQTGRQKPSGRTETAPRREEGRSEMSRQGAGSPSVREVRGQPGSSLTGRRTAPSVGRNLSGLGEERRPATGEEGEPRPSGLKPIAPAFAPQVPQPGRQELTLPASLASFGSRSRDAEPSNAGESTLSAAPAAPSPAPSEPVSVVQEAMPAPTPTPRVQSGALEDQIVEFARLTGYRLTLLGRGLVRLTADLGPAYGYTVLLATDRDALSSPEWDSGDDHRALITTEEDRAPGVPRLTREALVSLIEHARLAPLGALDLRGYWRAGDVDLDSAASVAELVSAHLAQRGTFTYVLLTLSQQPAQSLVNVSELAQRLGNGVSTDDMNAILDTLARPPFLAVTPLPNGQFLLRSTVTDLLADLADYAQGVRRRLRAPGGGTEVPRG